MGSELVTWGGGCAIAHRGLRLYAFADAVAAFSFVLLCGPKTALAYLAVAALPIYLATLWVGSTLDKYLTNIVTPRFALILTPTAVIAVIGSCFSGSRKSAYVARALKGLCNMTRY